jgi:DNA-binding response OmpR family regulator
VAIGRILRKQGYVVSEAGTIAGAIAGLSPPPDWVLLDLMLPDGCGISVLRRVQAQRLPTKVCIITGCDSTLLADARSAGAQHTFTKPLDIGILMEALASA